MYVYAHLCVVCFCTDQCVLTAFVAQLLLCVHVCVCLSPHVFGVLLYGSVCPYCVCRSGASQYRAWQCGFGQLWATQILAC